MGKDMVGVGLLFFLVGCICVLAPHLAAGILICLGALMIYTGMRVL